MNELYSNHSKLSLLSVVFLSQVVAFSQTTPLTGTLGIIVSANTDALQPRQEFSIPLSKISVATDEVTKKKLRVTILQKNGQDRAIITPTDDIFIKNTSKGTVKTVYREVSTRSYQISPFEAEQIDNVCKGFVQTLEIFERDLRQKKMDQCRYLDAFFPRFLRGFMILLSISTCSESYDKVATILPESTFDVSLNSQKTDDRIKQWFTTPDYTIKLRIVSKELAFQLKEWQQKELVNKNRNPELSKITSIEETLNLFIKVYFNFPADITSIEER